MLQCILQDVIDSTDDEEIILPPPIMVTNNEDDNDGDLLNVLNPVMEAMDRIQHVKVEIYIENIVRNYNNHDFNMHFRMSQDVVYTMIQRFAVSEVFTSLQEHAGHAPTTPDKHILSYLWFVGHESASYRDISDRFGMTISALHKVITRVTAFLTSIAPNIITFPSLQKREITKRFYLERKGFPGVIGAIDGSHVRINKPSEDHDSYVNRKQYFSIQIQGVVNHERTFMDVFIGSPGSVHDARIFRESPLYNSLDELCGEDGYILGDSAYPCLKHVIVPYRDNGHLTHAQRHFNQKLSSCRVVVEHAFRCLKQQFRQLYHFNLKDIVRMIEIVHACCVLHNIANVDDLLIFESPEDNDFEDIKAAEVAVVQDNVIISDNKSGKNLRNELCRQLIMQNN